MDSETPTAKRSREFLISRREAGFFSREDPAEIEEEFTGIKSGDLKTVSFAKIMVLAIFLSALVSLGQPAEIPKPIQNAVLP